MTGNATETPRPKGPILETRNLSRYFGQMAALSTISLSIREKEITSLIGPNGAGKTTFYNVITGRFPPSSGKVLFKGRDITGLPPHQIVKRGVGRSFQITSIFSGLTVLENVRAAVIARSSARMNLFTPVESSRSLYEQSMRYLELIGLEDKKDEPLLHPFPRRYEGRRDRDHACDRAGPHPSGRAHPGDDAGRDEEDGQSHTGPLQPDQNDLFHHRARHERSLLHLRQDRRALLRLDSGRRRA